MDWQQLLALLIVASTASLFLWGKLWKRKFSFEKDTHCGCGSSRGQIGPAQTIHFKARKGERPKVMVRNQ